MKTVEIKIDSELYKSKVYTHNNKDSGTQCDNCDFKQLCVKLRKHICATFYPLRTDIIFKRK